MAAALEPTGPRSQAANSAPSMSRGDPHPQSIWKEKGHLHSQKAADNKRKSGKIWGEIIIAHREK